MNIKIMNIKKEKIKYKLNQKLRRKLSNPLGKIFREKDLVLFLNQKIKNKRIIAVGDKTGKFLLENGFTPYLWIYDGKIRRRKIKGKLPFPTHVAINPPSMITESLCDNIDEILSSKNKNQYFRLFVFGEEDLATLYVLYKAKNSIVLYGQPDKGIVSIEINNEIKRKVKSILEEMKV